MRKLIVNGQEWGFFIGKHNAVLTPPDEGKKMILTLEAITGRSNYTINKGRKDKSKDGMITPSDIKAYIVKNFPLPLEEE